MYLLKKDGKSYRLTFRRCQVRQHYLQVKAGEREKQLYVELDGAH